MRRRPGMYFNLESPIVANCMAREAFCLAIDQISADTCTRVSTRLGADGFLTVEHDGRPLGVEPEIGFRHLSEMLFVAERLGFCADLAASEYVNTHVCKNGMTALNACSQRFELSSFHGDVHYRLCYERGERIGDLETVGTFKRTGVATRFKPDPSIIPAIDFDLNELQQWFATVPIDTSNVLVEWQIEH